jgi:hypothetical protein
MDNTSQNPDFFILRPMTADNKELDTQVFWKGSFNSDSVRWFEAGKYVEKWLKTEHCVSVEYEPIRVCTHHEEYDPDWEKGHYLDD